VLKITGRRRLEVVKRDFASDPLMDRIGNGTCIGGGDKYGR
jgi:hypothetical protein